jgi:GR25 family glycosyltransferase involved in LPS biosynthesis
MVEIPVYVLSLENRIDRQKSVSKALNESGIGFQFILSSKSDNTKFEAMSKITQIEVAIWSSHVKALKAMLGTASSWALVLEDDFLFEESGLRFLKNQQIIHSTLDSLSGHYSILQIGFLENSKSSKKNYLLAKGFKLIFRFNRFDFRSYLNNFRHLGFKNASKINKILKFNGFIKINVLFGLRLGTHAYFVNRDAAKILIDIFENRESDKNFMTIDQYLLKLTKKFSKNPTLPSARLSETLVRQSSSPSDNLGKTPATLLESK